tara:strand:- start:8564 stop:8887 length:324 start_codon:yes stop_codon:yes gene_type:complete
MKLTTEQIRQIINLEISKLLSEMQLSIPGIEETGVSMQEKEDALRRYYATTERGRKELLEDFIVMSQGEDVIDEYEPEGSPERNIRTRYYSNWSDEDFKWVLSKIKK